MDKAENIEIELRYLLLDKIGFEKKILDLGGKLIYHAHVIDYWYVPFFIKNQEQQDEWYDSGRGCAVRIREQDNGYTGRITTSLETKRLTSDLNHNTLMEAEVTVDNYLKVKNMLEMMDLKEFLIIDKNRQVYQFEDFKLCIDDVKDLGVGAEIEYVGKSDRESALKKLRDFAIKLGLKRKDELEKSLTVLAMLKLAKY